MTRIEQPSLPRQWTGARNQELIEADKKHLDAYMEPSSSLLGWKIATEKDSFRGCKAVTFLPSIISTLLLLLQEKWFCWEHRGLLLSLLDRCLAMISNAGDAKWWIWSPTSPSNISAIAALGARATFPCEGSFIFTNRWPNNPPLERERMSCIAKIIYTWSCSLVSGEKGDAFLLI